MGSELTLFLVALCGLILMIFVISLPTLFELKKPQDAGPRNISNSKVQTLPTTDKTATLTAQDELEIDNY
jgi:hypothetical protein